MDKVFIRELRVDTVIGVYDWERKIQQTVVLDIEMAWDNRRAAATDDLSKALDYNAVSQRLMAYIKSTQFQLIETLAEQCSDILLNEFFVPWLRLRLSKPGAVPEAATVGLVIERGDNAAKSKC